jgi:transcriptional regulator with XRE-family HTH domain
MNEASPRPARRVFRRTSLNEFAAASRATRDIAQALAARRRAQGLSQTTVAERMNTSQSAIARIEQGAGVTLATLLRYARAVDARLEWSVVALDEGTVADESAAAPPDEPGEAASA